MKVFIENEAGSDNKNIYNEKELRFIKSYKVSRSYPYPYGFIIDTTSGDGDNLDCFVITSQALKQGDVVEVEPIALMEQIEDNAEDHNILATLANENQTVSEEIKAKLKEFVEHVLDHLKNKSIRAGNFHSKEAAVKLIEKLADK